MLSCSVRTFGSRLHCIWVPGVGARFAALNRVVDRIGFGFALRKTTLRTPFRFDASTAGEIDYSVSDTFGVNTVLQATQFNHLQSPSPCCAFPTNCLEPHSVGFPHSPLISSAALTAPAQSPGCCAIFVQTLHHLVLGCTAADHDG